MTTIGVHTLRTVDEKRAEELLQPLRAEAVAPDLVDFLVTRVGGGMQVARLQGRADREFEIAFNSMQSEAVAHRLRTDATFPEATARRAAEVVRLASIYAEGCGNATSPDDTAQDCAQCSRDFLRRVEEALKLP